MEIVKMSKLFIQIYGMNQHKVVKNCKVEIFYTWFTQLWQPSIAGSGYSIFCVYDKEKLFCRLKLQSGDGVYRMMCNINFLPHKDFCMHTGQNLPFFSHLTRTSSSTYLLSFLRGLRQTENGNLLAFFQQWLLCCILHWRSGS